MVISYYIILLLYYIILSCYTFQSLSPSFAGFEEGGSYESYSHNKLISLMC